MGNARIQFIPVTLLALLLGAGCAHVQKQDEAFLASARKAVPEVRVFAWRQLKQPTEDEVRVIATTEPRIDHVSYQRVNFHWPNLCTVVAGPPPCKPELVFDYRKKQWPPAANRFRGAPRTHPGCPRGTAASSDTPPAPPDRVPR